MHITYEFEHNISINSRSKCSCIWWLWLVLFTRLKSKRTYLSRNNVTLYSFSLINQQILSSMLTPPHPDSINPLSINFLFNPTINSSTFFKFMRAQRFRCIIIHCNVQFCVCICNYIYYLVITKNHIYCIIVKIIIINDQTFLSILLLNFFFTFFLNEN